jgi:polysaccharide deacetylase family protein (PEP-CTERM system associated)
MSQPIILSFDIEEHYRIEAAHGYDCPAPLKEEYNRRMESTTYQLLDLLAEYGAKATFFIVGQIAFSHPKLIRDIHAQGHEIASHSWDHERIHRLNPKSFRRDLLLSKHALEQVSGSEIVGYRAPTFSIDHRTAWALDILNDCGFRYDSSIFPVRHDRYGIPNAPRMPFRAVSRYSEMLEIPPTTWRLFKMNLPVAGGGYFRLFPLMFMKLGIRQCLRLDTPAAMLYFHPWEFDVGQPKLPLNRLSKLRTYIGIGKSIERFRRLLKRYTFQRAIDVVEQLDYMSLPEYPMYVEGENILEYPSMVPVPEREESRRVA